MKRFPTLLVPVAMLAFAAASLAADPRPTPPPTTKTPAASDSKPPAGPATPPDQAAPAGGAGNGKTAQPGTPPAGKQSSTPEHFEPSEKVRPDFDVAFPVDI